MPWPLSVGVLFGIVVQHHSTSCVAVGSTWALGMADATSQQVFLLISLLLHTFCCLVWLRESLWYHVKVMVPRCDC